MVEEVKETKIDNEEVVEETEKVEADVKQDKVQKEPEKKVSGLRAIKLRLRTISYGVIALMVIFVGYLAWLNNHVKGFVEHSSYISATNEKTSIKDFVGNDEKVDTVKNGVLRASLFNPNLAEKEFYIQKEIAAVGYAYEENGSKYDFGNIVDEPNAPVNVKAITKEEFETKAADYHVVDEKKYEKIENKEEIQKFLNAVGMPYEEGKTYYKYISGTYTEKYALTVDK
jgi:hypothetical protein